MVKTLVEIVDFCRSNALFSLWSKYQSKVPKPCFRDKLLSVADTLYQTGLFQLARNHGYRRCLMEAGVFTSPEQTLEEFVLQCEDEPVILAVVSSAHLSMKGMNFRTLFF